MKHLLSLLFGLILCVLLVPSALSESGSDSPAFGDPLDQFFQRQTFIDQSAPDLQDKAYYYSGAKFAKNGCGPASIVNAMIALCGLEDQETASQLLLESTLLLCNNKKPKDAKVDPKYLSYFCHPDPEKSPVLSSFVKGLGQWIHVNEKNDASWAIEQLSQVSVSPYTLSWRTTQANLYADLANLLTYLHTSQSDHAAVIVTYVTGGTEGTAGPFKTQGGHYICLYIPVGRWAENGTFYLIDSQPRALKEETAGRAPYWSKYAFLKGYNTVPFRETWTWKRIQPSCLRFDWTSEKNEAMAGMAEDLLAEAYTAQLRLLCAYGSGVIFVHIPPEKT